jgi:long-chain acyl-CoA synthetase
MRVFMLHICILIVINACPRCVGVKKYDKVGIIANNCWEWATIAAAAYSLSASLVPMYEAQLPSDWTYIINDSGCSTVFCATPQIFEKVQKEVLPSTPRITASICLDAPANEPFSFAAAMASFSGDDEGILIQAPIQENLANLIYTSGKHKILTVGSVPVWEVLKFKI